MTAEYTCALWTARYHTPDFDLFETEQEAARMAVAINDGGEGVAEGVQFRDGRIFSRAEWPAYAEAETRYWRELDEQMDAMAKRPKPAMRKIRHPLPPHTVIEVEADGTPEWVGLPL